MQTLNEHLLTFPARTRIVGAADAMQLVRNADIVAVGGFGGIGFAEGLTLALEERFLKTGSPSDPTLVVGVLTVEWALDKAKIIFGAVANGDDPAEGASPQETITVAEVCDWYLAEAESPRTPGPPDQTLHLGNGPKRIETHIKPLIGRRQVRALRLTDIAGMWADIAAGKPASLLDADQTPAASRRRLGLRRRVDEKRRAPLAGPDRQWASAPKTFRSLSRPKAEITRDGAKLKAEALLIREWNGHRFFGLRTAKPDRSAISGRRAGVCGAASPDVASMPIKDSRGACGSGFRPEAASP